MRISTPASVALLSLLVGCGSSESSSDHLRLYIAPSEGAIFGLRLVDVEPPHF